MNGGDEVVAAPVDPPQPLEWKFSQVFGERTAGEEVQEATFRSTNTAGIGVIVRDCAGEVIGALSLPIPMPQSVAAAEALACRRAVMFAAEIGLTRVVIEGDSCSCFGFSTVRF
ncbi:serine/threonine protein phosphatase 2A 55 kDa regulatory subunit B alpha isoform-like [Quercus suber]|uniref:serine/threonine protein phosphatase 2A 55 kDa regulatory subunit B alpha isoform-like n=1 Tax=Quercus suber TaxID=58331 RepID=UPI0032DF74C7